MIFRLILAALLGLFCTNIISQNVNDLYSSIKANDLEKVKKIVESGVSLRVVDKNGASPLIWSIYKGDLDLVKYIYKNGSNEAIMRQGFIFFEDNGKDEYYASSVCAAIGEGKLEVLEYFSDSLKILERLINNANPELDFRYAKKNGFKGSRGPRGPIDWALYRKNSKIIDYLNGKGFIKKYGTEYALIEAVEGRDKNLVRMLVDHGYLSRDRQGLSLMKAIENEDSYIANFLIEKGINMNGKAAKFSMIEAAKMNLFEVIEKLASKKMNPNFSDKEDWTPMMWAIYNQNSEVFKLVDSCGGKIRTTNDLIKILHDYVQKKLDINEVIDFVKVQYESIDDFNSAEKWINSDSLSIIEQGLKVQLKNNDLKNIYEEISNELNRRKRISSYFGIDYSFKAVEAKILISQAIYGNESKQMKADLDELSHLYSNKYSVSIIDDKYSKEESIFFYKKAKSVYSEFFNDSKNSKENFTRLQILLEEINLQNLLTEFAYKGLINGEKFDMYNQAELGQFKKVITPIIKKGLEEISKGEVDSIMNQFFKIGFLKSDENNGNEKNSSTIIESMNWEDVKTIFPTMLGYVLDGTSSDSMMKAADFITVVPEMLGSVEEAEELILKSIKRFTLMMHSNSYHFDDKIRADWVTSYLGQSEVFLSYLYRHFHNQELINSISNFQLSIKNGLLNSQISFRNYMRTLDPETRLLYRNWLLNNSFYSKNLSEEPNNIMKLDSTYFVLIDLEEKLNQKDVTPERVYTIGDVSKRLKGNEAYLDFNSFQYWNVDHWADSVYTIVFLIKGNDPDVVYIPLFEDKEIIEFKSANSIDELNYNMIKKVGPYLQGIDTVYFSPSGLLNLFNISALSFAKKQNWIQISSNKALFNSSFELIEKGNKALLLGGVNFNELNKDKHLLEKRYFNDKYWPYLPGSELEVQYIQRTLENIGVDVTVYTEKDASEGNIKEYLKENKPRIIHLATHGYFYENPRLDFRFTNSVFENYYRNAEDPLVRSGLILAGGNITWDSNKAIASIEDDGILTAKEISGMDLSGTDIVVLSACDTGLGDINGSEGVYGLQRAFKLAGVKFIIMTLSKVEDDTSDKLMRRFYTYWLSSRMSIRRAFEKAKQKTLEKCSKKSNGEKDLECENELNKFILIE